MKHFKCHCTLEVQLYLLVSRHYFPLPRCHWLHSYSLHKFHFSTPEKVRIWPKLKKGTQKSRKDGLGLQEQFCERVTFSKVSSGRLSSLANVSSDNSEPSPFKAAVFPWKRGSIKIRVDVYTILKSARKCWFKIQRFIWFRFIIGKCIIRKLIRITFYSSYLSNKRSITRFS